MIAETALISLGFTDLEARIYCELLKNSPATGYKLAQAVGKAAANVYQALNMLEQKGAVVVDDGKTKSFRAIAPDELLAALQSRFSQRSLAAKTALEQLHAPAPSDRIYQLRDLTQVVTRARQMLADARETILFDLFPAPLALLKADLAAAARRGVQVTGLVYTAEAPTEFVCMPAYGMAWALTDWPGSQLSLVVDASEFLVALLSDDGGHLHQGYWSDSYYLSCLQHSHLGCELRLSSLRLGSVSPTPYSLPMMKPRGFRELMKSAPKVATTKA